MFKVLHECGWARVGEIKTRRGTIKTPAMAVVVNPHKQVVKVNELTGRFKVDLLMTNAYIAYKDPRLRTLYLERGIHAFLEFRGPIYTDSGAFQMYSRGRVDVKPEEILKFQVKAGSDFITVLDVFTFPSDEKPVAERKLAITLERIREARETVKEAMLVGPIQGGLHLDLRAKAARSVAKIGVDVFAVGGIVPLMEGYRFKELVAVTDACVRNLPRLKPVHAFGVGHPLSIPLLVAMGVDLFDTASYAVYAEDDRYITAQLGTLRLEEIEEFPCSCPVCTKYTPKEVKDMLKPERVRTLSLHNLYVILREIRLVRELIRDCSLPEYLEMVSATHPRLIDGVKLLKQLGYIKEKL